VPPGRPRSGAGAPRRRRRRGPQGDYALWLAWLGVVMIGFNTVRIAEYTVSDLIFVLSAGVIVTRLLTGRTRDLAPAEARRSSPLVLVGSLLLLTGATLSSLGAWNPFESMGVVLRLGWLTLVWFWILRSVCVDRRALNKLLRGWRLTLIITAIAGVLGELGVQALQATNAEERQTGFFGHPNELGGLLATGLPLLLLGLPWGDDERKGTPLLGRLALVGLVVFSMATTGSISAFFAAILATGITFGSLAFTRREGRPVRRSTPLVVIGLTGVLSLGVLWLSTSDLPIVDRLTRFSEGSSSVNDSVASRSSLNDFVVGHIDEVLLVGIGLDKGSLDEAIQNGGGNSASLADHASVIHNIHLRVLFESGLPALVGLWMLIAVGFGQVRRLLAYTKEDDELRPIAIALFGSMTACNVFALFQPILFHRYYWLPVALTSALWALVRSESRARHLAELADLEPRPLPVLPSNDDHLPPIEL
jgi:hypothetical protein